MKRNLLALAAIAAIAGSAHAAPLDRAGAAGATNKLYISGSSALQKLVEGMLAQNCNADGMTIWRSATGGTFGGSSTPDTADGASHNIYACTLKAGNDFGAGYDGQTVLIVKREAGGSAQGVFPVGKNQAQLLMDINNAACTAAPAVSPAYGTCPTGAEFSTQADMGISDEEPSVFNATFNKPAAFAPFTVTDADFDSAPTSFGLTVLGLAVNGKLYQDLQADQGTTGVPTIQSAAFASLMSSSYPVAEAWSPFFSPGFAGLKSTHVNVAFRAAGSGTRGAAGLYFNNYPSGKVAKNFATGVTTNTFNGNVDGGRSIFNASSSGNVIGALDGCGASKYCVGILGLEQNISGKDVFFVRVDGGLPTSARLGQYGLVYEPTTQINKTVVNAGGKAFAAAFTNALAVPANINAAFGGQGVLALPGNCPGTSYTAWTSPPESVVCSRVTRSGSSNNSLSIVK